MEMKHIAHTFAFTCTIMQKKRELSKTLGGVNLVGGGDLRAGGGGGVGDNILKANYGGGWRLGLYM